MKMINVERMPQTVHYDGKTYGPSEKPLSIPEELAAALGLTPVNGSFSPEVTAEVDHEELEASRTLAKQAKDNLDRLLGQLAPLAQDGEMPDQVLARAIAERDAFKADMLTAQREKHEANQFADRELDKASKDFDEQVQAAQRARDDGMARISELEAQRNDLTSQLTDALARPVLPADAHARLVKINGVAEKLAAQILDALKVEPEAVDAK